MINVIEVADGADVIVDGYAFTRSARGIRVLNLNNPVKAAVFLENGDTIETTMDDIELVIVSKYLANNMKYMGALDA